MPRSPPPTSPPAPSRAATGRRCRTAGIECRVCPRFCRLREGQRGLCFVRARQGDQVVLTSYGRSSGFCIDPIEKKPLNHFLPGHAGAQLRHGGLQPRLQVLPEPRHLEEPRDGPADVARRPGGSGAGGAARGRALGRLHLQRPGDLPGIRRRHGRGLPRGGREERRGHGRLYLRRAPRGVLRADGRGQCRPQGLHRGFLSQADRRPSAAGAGDAGIPRAPHRDLGRDHDAADPGRERLRGGDPRALRMGRRQNSGRTCRCTSRPSTPISG